MLLDGSNMNLVGGALFAQSKLSTESNEALEAMANLQWSAKGDPHYAAAWQQAKLLRAVHQKLSANSPEAKKKEYIEACRLEFKRNVASWVQQHPNAKPEEMRGEVKRQLEVFQSRIAPLFPPPKQAARPRHVGKYSRRSTRNEGHPGEASASLLDSIEKASAKRSVEIREADRKAREIAAREAERKAKEEAALDAQRKSEEAAAHAAQIRADAAAAQADADEHGLVHGDIHRAVVAVASETDRKARASADGNATPSSVTEDQSDEYLTIGSVEPNEKLPELPNEQSNTDETEDTELPAIPSVDTSENSVTLEKEVRRASQMLLEATSVPSESLPSSESQGDATPSRVSRVRSGGSRRSSGKRALPPPPPSGSGGKKNTIRSPPPKLPPPDDSDEEVI